MGWWKSKKQQPEIIWHVPEGRDDLVPQRATKGSMAYDFVSPETITVPKYDPKLGVGSALINLMLVATLPLGYGLVLRSRSGLANKEGLTVEAGEIDQDYLGLLRVLLFNHSGVDYTVNAGDRIAQARVVKIHKLKESVSYTYPDPDKTLRGSRGFGSTGK